MVALAIGALRFAPGAYEIKDINEVIQEVVFDK